MIPSKFSERLIAARKKMGITQKELAERIDIAPSSLSAYEHKGKYPTLDVAVRLADALNVSLDWLSGRVDEENPVSIEYDKDIAEAFVKITMFENTVAKIGYREIDPRDDDTISESDMDSYCVFGMADDGEYGEFILPSKWATFEIRNSAVADFCKAWADIYKLHQSGTINDELYALWIDKRLDEMLPF